MNDRILKLQKMMASDNVDAALYATSGSMQYFLGDGSYLWHRTRDSGGGKSAEEWYVDCHFLNRPDCILYIPADGEPVLFLTYDKCDAMRHFTIKKTPCFSPMMGDVLKPVVKGKKRVACGESCNKELVRITLEADNGIEVTNAERYAEKLRLIKEAGEIEKLRRAAEFTDNAMGIIASALKPGITPRQVRELIAAIALKNGLQGISFCPAAIFVRQGDPSSNEIFGFPDDEPLTEGTSIGFDYGFTVDGYSSDYGRSFYCGKNEKAKDAYKALHEAQLFLLGEIRPGKPMDMCFNTVYKKLDDIGGFGKYLRRAGDCEIMGHQIGIDVHERPWLRCDEKACFQPGMVMCIEPKIWWPGLCYLRVEDMVLITENGGEPLTKFDRDYFEL